jgi:hypothetical protein
MKFKSIRKDTGFVLVSALILLTCLSLIVVTVTFRNTGNEVMAANQRDSVRAMTIAESGIEAGFALIRRDYVKLRQFVVDDLAPYGGSPLLAESIAGGAYSLTVPVINPDYVVISSLGDTTGAERHIEVVLEIDGNATSRYAILTEDDINALQGDPEFTGPFANIHSNSDILIEGSPDVSGTVSATGTVTIHGNPSIGAEISGAARVDIPHVYPPAYRDYATIVFTPDCIVEQADGTAITDLSNGGTWNGWTCEVGERWVMSGNVPGELYEAFYYVEGNISLEGNPNGIWYGTFVAEGYISVSGTADYRPWGSKAGNNTGDHSANEVLFLAGNDLMVVGTPAQDLNGILAAHMEVHLSGNPTVAGSIVAENGLHGAGQEVTTGQAVVDLVVENEFEGSMVMDASGTAIIGGGNPVKVSAWRELVL